MRVFGWVAIFYMTLVLSSPIQEKRVLEGMVSFLTTRNSSVYPCSLVSIKSCHTVKLNVSDSVKKLMRLNK